MILSIKKLIIISIAILFPLTFSGCNSKTINSSSLSETYSDESSSTQSQTINNQKTVETEPYEHSQNSIDTSKDKKQQILQDNGYAVCHLQDYSGDVLVILSHAAEVNRQFEFYLIKNDELENIGALDGTDITAYISNDTNCFCICRGKDNVYNLGTVKYNNGIIVEWTDTLINEKTNMDIDYPGKVISFKSTDGSEFKNKYADKIKYSENLDEIDE